MVFLNVQYIYKYNNCHLYYEIMQLVSQLLSEASPAGLYSKSVNVLFFCPTFSPSLYRCIYFRYRKKFCLAVLFFIVFCYFEESGRHFVTVNCLTTKTKSLITNLFAYVTTGSIRDARKNSAAQWMKTKGRHTSFTHSTFLTTFDGLLQALHVDLP